MTYTTQAWTIRFHLYQHCKAVTLHAHFIILCKVQSVCSDGCKEFAVAGARNTQNSAIKSPHHLELLTAVHESVHTKLQFLYFPEIHEN